MIQAPEDPVLHAAIEGLLLERGPLTVPELVAALGELDIDFGRDESAVEDALWGSYGTPFVHLTSRWAHLPSLLLGRVFTHRLTGREIDNDLLDLSPDLVAIAGLEDTGTLQLANGSEVTVAYGFEADDPDDPNDPDDFEDERTEALADSGSIVLPPGTLGGLGVHPGDLLGITMTGGAVELARVEGEVATHTAAARSHLVEIASTGIPLELETVVLTLCADSDDLFRSPQPPFGELVAETGLATNGDWVASAGFDFGAYWDTVRAQTLADRHDLSTEQGVSVTALLKLHRQVLDTWVEADDAGSGHETLEPGGSLEDGVMAAALASVHPSTSDQIRDGGLSLRHIATPEVAEAFFIETEVLADEVGDVALANLVELLEEKAPHSARPALRWLRAMTYERMGRISEAEDTLLAAERLDPTWPLTLLDLARYASDRGDSSRGLALLARADPYEDPGLTELLQSFRPEPGPTVGRNEPCWCGSGRKFKQCHLHRPIAPPLEERARWLYRKAVQFLSSPAWYSLLSGVAAQRAAYEETDAAAKVALQDPAVGDVTLFEGGVFAEFVRLRGFLLPDDERLLAEQWLQVERSVFDITAVRPGAGLTVRDLRTGEVLEIRERTASRTLRTGQLVCARVVPAGETWQIFGGIEPVALHDRDALLSLLDVEPDPELLMAFLSRRFAPPTLVTGDGDPLVVAEVVLEVTDPLVISAELDGRFVRIEDNEQPVWHVTKTIKAGERIQATLRLDGTELTVSAISDRRLETVLAALREIDPGAKVLTADRQPMADMQAALRQAQGAGAAPRSGSEHRVAIRGGAPRWCGC